MRIGAIFVLLTISSSAADCEEVLKSTRPLIHSMAGMFYSQYRFALAKRGMTVDDIESEFLYAAWQSLRYFDEKKGGLDSFLKTKFRWRMRDLLRVDKDLFEKKLSIEDLQETSFEPVSDDRGYDLESVATGEQWRRVLDTARRLLSKPKLNVFGLYWYGLSSTQISQVTGMRHRSVNASLQHSIAELRRVMGPYQ